MLILVKYKAINFFPQAAFWEPTPEEITKLLWDSGV